MKKILTLILILLPSMCFAFNDFSSGVMNTPIATSSRAGSIKPDGTSITIQPDGTISSVLSASSLSTSGNLTFTGTGNRITGDFTSPTVVDRVLFQTSTVSGATSVSAIPNNGATPTTALFRVYNTADPTNALATTMTSSSAGIGSFVVLGTGSVSDGPMVFFTGNGSHTSTERMRVLATTGNVLMGSTTETAGAEKLQVTGAISASGAILAGGGANTIYWCDGTITGGNLCRGNACTGCTGTWTALSLKTD